MKYLNQENGGAATATATATTNGTRVNGNEDIGSAYWAKKRAQISSGS